MNPLEKVDIQERESYFPKCCQNLDTLCENRVLVTKSCKTSQPPLMGVEILFLVFLILGLVVLAEISLEPRAHRLSEAMWYVSLSLGPN